MRKTTPILWLILSLSSCFTATAQTSNDVDSVLRVVKEQKDSIKVKSLMKIGSLYNLKGLPDSAGYYQNMAMEYAKEHGTQRQICAIHLAIAETKTRLAEYDAALEHLFTILRIAGNGDAAVYASKAKPVIGFIYIWQKKEKEALRYFLEAETELEKWRDTSGLIAVYANLPVCVALNGDTITAMKYFKKGFDIVDKYALGGPPGSRKEFVTDKKLGFTYNMINFFIRKEDLLVALDKMKQLQGEVESGENNYQRFSWLSILAAIHLRLKNYGEAQSYGEQALQLYKAEGNYSELLDIQWVVAEASASLKQYEKAYNSLLLYKQYNDSVFKFSKIEAINSVEAKYQVEKKEQQIASLNKQRKAQRVIGGLAISSLLIVLGLLAFLIRSARLQKKLFAKEKEVQKREREQRMFELQQTALRAQMNPHFIFNCLNSVQRYIINNDVNGVNYYLATFANLIRKTLENSGRQLISLKDEMQYLETYIKMEQMRSNNKFDYHINVQDDIDASDTYIPNMIIQPFVENSILHGVTSAEGRGIIRIDISQKSKLNISVEDNGTGIRPKTTTEENDHVPMGSSITEKRIALYNSIYEDKIELEITDRSIQGSNESGTLVTLKFPLKAV